MSCPRLKVGCHAQIHQKPRTLAFRTSSTAKHNQVSFQTFHHHILSRSHQASSITPPESSEVEHGQGPCSRTPPISPNDPCGDCDIDMADAQPSVSSRLGEDFDTAAVTPPRPVTMNLSLETPPREFHESIHGGRVATPRWDHFRSRDMGMELCDVAEDDFPDGSLTSRLEWNHRTLLHRRRLPSPIGEDIGITSSPAVTGVPMEGSKWVHSEDRNAAIVGQTVMLTESTSNDTNKISTRGKTMLSMGYRADCEKCRTRVPGHYNHVIRT